MVFVHVLVCTVLGTVSLILFENLVHNVLTIFLILPSIGTSIPSISWLLVWILILRMPLLIIIILTVRIVLVRIVRRLLLIIKTLAGAWLAVGPRLIVLFLDISFTQDLVGLIYLLKLFLIASTWVRMVLFSQIPKRLLNLFLAWRLLDTQNLVIILW